MQKLSVQQRASILRCLVEGSSLRATARMTGISFPSVLAYLVRTGEALGDYHSRMMRNLSCEELQLDEIWSFVGCKDKAKSRAIGKHPGDVWTWTALCAKTKLIPGWTVGDRTFETGFAFCKDLAARVKGKCQITSDGHPVYTSAVPFSFPDADFAQLIKIYGKDAEGKDTVIGTEKHPIMGAPVEANISTSYVERSNLTIRMGNRRFTRLTNAFSKKFLNHCFMLALQFTHYNFCRRHMTLKQTPAMAAGVLDRQLSIEELVLIVESERAAKDNAAFEKAFAEKYGHNH